MASPRRIDFRGTEDAIRERRPGLEGVSHLQCGHKTRRRATSKFLLPSGGPFRWSLSALPADIAPGDYALYVAAQNLGVDQLSLGEEGELSDAEFADRKDLEWYRLFLVPGQPAEEGFIVDRPTLR